MKLLFDVCVLYTGLCVLALAISLVKCFEEMKKNDKGYASLAQC